MLNGALIFTLVANNHHDAPNSIFEEEDHEEVTNGKQYLIYLC